MPAKVIGLRFLEQPPTPVWRQGFGWTSDYVLEGRRAEVDAAVAAYAGAAGVIEIRYQDLGADLWRATVSFAGQTREQAQNPPNPDTQVEVTWAFPRNDLQRDIWTHPRVEAQLRRMNAVYRARFRADVEAWIQGTTSVEAPKPGATNASDTTDLQLTRQNLIDIARSFGAQEAEIGAFLDVLTEGQLFYIHSRRVLRWTRTGPTQGEWFKANSNTNRVFRRSTLISQITPPTWVQLKMPDGYWFKHEPEEQQTGTKLEMAQEFEYFGASYSTFTYGDPL